MAYKDLQEFIHLLDKKDLLKRIKVKVDPVLEITEITDRVSKQYGPALLFENVKGSKFPVLINAMLGTYERMAMALGVKDLDEIGHDIKEFINMSNYLGVMNKVKSVPRLTRMASVFPVKLPTKGACQQVIHIMILICPSFQLLKCWPQDAGKIFYPSFGFYKRS